MGLLDNNIIRTQGREKNATLFTSLTGVSAYTANKIDCRGFNSLVVSLNVATADTTLQLVGFYPDGTTTLFNKLYVIDFTNNINYKNPTKKELTTLKISSDNRFAIDVSMFDYIGIGKTVSDSSSVTCKYQVYQKEINTESFNYNGFYLLKNGTGSIGSTVFLDGQEKGNAILFKYNTVGEGPGFSVILTMDDGTSKDITTDCFCINKNKFISKDYDFYPDGTYYFAVPISKNGEKISLSQPATTNTVKVEYKIIDYNFNKKENVYSYWEKQTGAIGGANLLPIPLETKKAVLVIIGNLASVGSKIKLYFTERNLDTIGDSSKMVSFNGVKKIYNKTANSIITNGEVVITNSIQYVYFDPTNIGWISMDGSSGLSAIKTQFIFSNDEAPISIRKKIQFLDEFTTPVTITDALSFVNRDLVKIFEDNNAVVYKNIAAKTLVATLNKIVVWTSTTAISLSIDGFDGVQEEIILNSTNFPNLISGSTIERVVLMPWTRNATTSYPGSEWRMNVITQNGQVYHNFPSRAIGSDGVVQSTDYKLFDESCVWELPERWTPVKTNVGSDATLISTGKYKYFPCLPDSAYEMHPLISTDNGYGNGGYPATITKTKSDGGTTTFGRFYAPMRGIDTNSFGFMGGFEADNKISILGTYKSNSPTTGSVRICVFMSNDGGRNWFCRYEYGSKGDIINSIDANIRAADATFLLRNLISVGMAASAGTSLFNVIKRSQYVPSSASKEIEKTKKFKYYTPIAVASIVDSGSDIIVNTTTNHNFIDGEIILFEKQISAAASEWDWIINTGFDGLSFGNGVHFKVKYINATSFRLMEAVNNPHNNLQTRHIHSINKCKDGFAIGAGEVYPDGWILWLSVIASDAFISFYPWDTLSLTRLNSTVNSVQRPLGILLKQDQDNTVYVGVDNEKTELGNVLMPPDRTDTFKRSSQGVWKGKLVDFDSQALFTCIFESREVCYFFKEIYGTMIYIGQLGHVGISNDEGKTWSQLNINKQDVSRPGGISSDGFICIENYLFKSK
jgi:hypothetical protein